MKRHSYGRDEDSAITILTRAQDRALRAAAWRHVRQIIDRQKAAHIWVSSRRNIKD